jgi:hypothetical protein
LLQLFDILRQYVCVSVGIQENLYQGKLLQNESKVLRDWHAFCAAAAFNESEHAKMLAPARFPPYRTLDD